MKRCPRCNKPAHVVNDWTHWCSEGLCPDCCEKDYEENWKEETS